MEEIFFTELCSRMPEQMLYKVVTETVKNNKERFCDFFKYNVQEAFPGFRSTQNIPLRLLGNKIVKKCKENPLIAQALLEEWYKLKKTFVIEIKEILEKLSYKCKEPDFESLKISFEYLKEEHSINKDDLCYANLFNQEVDEDKLFEITLITIFLGWFPSLKENIMSSIEQTPRPHTKEFEDAVNSPDELIKQLNQHYNSFERYKTQLNELLDSISLALKDEKQISLKENNLSIINSYNDAYSNVIKIAEKLSKAMDSLQIVKSEEVPIPLKIDFNKETLSTIKQKLFNHFEEYLKIIDNFIQEKLSANNNLLVSIDEEVRSKLENSLKDIEKKYLSNKSFDVAQEIINNLVEIEKNIKIDIDSYTIEIAFIDLEIKSSKRAEKFILDFFKTNGATDLDMLIFFLFLLPEEISLSIELKNYLLQLFVKFLSELNRDQLVAYISEDAIHKLISDLDDGKKLLAIFAILLYTFNKIELATSIIYKEGVYESVSDYDIFKKIVDVIAKGQDLKFYVSKIDELNKYEELLNSYFSRNSEYEKITSGIEKKYKAVFDNKILPELTNIYSRIVASKNLSDEQSLIHKISSPEYSSDLYHRSKGDLPKNYSLEKKIERIIENIVKEIKTYYEYKKYEKEFSEKEYIPSNKLDSELHNFFENNPILSPMKKTVFNILSNFKDNQEKPKVNYSLEFKDYVASLILDSQFYTKHCTDIIKNLNEKKLSIDEMYQIIKSNFESQTDIKSTLEKLKSAHCFRSLQLLKDFIDYENLKLIEEWNKIDMQEMKELEKFLTDNNKILPEEYFYFKEQGRLKYCKDILMQIRHLVLDEKKRSSEMLVRQFDDLQKISAKTRLELIDEKDGFSEQNYGQILEALKVIDEISHLKKENKISLANSLLKEIEHLRQFNNESLDQLNRLLKQYSENEAGILFKDSIYIKMPLIDIIKYMQADDYLSLGLKKQQWMEISSDRKEYIMDLIEKWLFLQNKPSTKEDIKKAKLEIDEIVENFSELVKNLCSICSLYKTNDNKKIGIEPTQEWDYSTDLPFLFTSKLQSPRCSSLDNPINFFVLTQLQTSSKKYINRIKDFISEKHYDQTSFNVIILLDSKEKFEKINTSSLTKNLPILDEFALKRIIFSVAENRLPKWQFVSLLTLNKKISTIQPFKTQGSVDNYNGIFVGRTEIIKEITTSKKDFAIYGGRKIGKSSLLAVISDILIKNGYIISIQSFQGIDNSLTIAKSIVEDLKNGGLNSTSLIPINSLDDFSFNLLSLYRENNHKSVAIILDEMDELIHKERKLGRHQIIEIFRNISHTTNHQWRFIFAGFKEMYLEIHGKGIYENWKNPWQNFVDDSNKQLTEIESPRELIDEGLRDILGLEYEKEIINLITEYSTGHPAFLQKFCECLVKSIDNRISLENRRIYEKDVKDVFARNNEFINFVKETLDLNLSTMQELITVIAAMNDREIFNSNWILNEIKTYIDLFDKQIAIHPKNLDLELELLTITGIIKRTANKEEFRFTHPYYIKILKRLEILDKNLIEDLINKICKSDEV